MKAYSEQISSSYETGKFIGYVDRKLTTKFTKNGQILIGKSFLFHIGPFSSLFPVYSKGCQIFPFYVTYQPPLNFWNNILILIGLLCKSRTTFLWVHPSPPKPNFQFHRFIVIATKDSSRKFFVKSPVKRRTKGIQEEGGGKKESFIKIFMLTRIFLFPYFDGIENRSIVEKKKLVGTNNRGISFLFNARGQKTEILCTKGESRRHHRRLYCWNSELLITSLKRIN